MKKNTIYIAILAILALISAACKKDFLNPVPESILTSKNFFGTANDMEQAIIAIYSSLQSRKPTDFLIMELPSDELYNSANTVIASAYDIDNLTINSENNTVLDFWTATYNGIFRANSALANIDNPTNYAALQKEQLTGEAEFLRALFYFDLARVFGGVPKVTSMLSISEAKTTPRASEDEIYSLIIEDLKDAIGKLPDPDGIARGRASKAAAVGLLAKVYVYRKDWDNAKTYLDQMAGFDNQLVSDFSSLWKTETEDNEEVIFSVKYTDGTNGQILSTDFIPNGGALGIVDKGEEVALPSWSLLKKYDVEDTRKAATISEDYTPPNPPGAPTIKYPYVSKYSSEEHTFGASGLDLPVLRYADIVLLRAETLYNLNQPDLALTELNRIRERAFGNADHDYILADISSLDAFYDKLLLERQLEFAYENERWFDLVRTGRFLTTMAVEERGYNFFTQTSDPITLNPQPYMKYFPIPYTQIIQAADGALTQNDGYPK